MILNKKFVLICIILIFLVVIIIYYIFFFDPFSEWSRPEDKFENVTTEDGNEFNILYTKYDFPSTGISICIQNKEGTIISKHFKTSSSLYKNVSNNWNKLEYVTEIEGIKCYLTPWCILYGENGGDLTGVYSDNYESEMIENEIFNKIYMIIMDKKNDTSLEIS